MELLNPGVFVVITYWSGNFLGTWFSGDHGNDRLMLELNDSRGLFQHKKIIDSSVIIMFDSALELILWSVFYLKEKLILSTG